MQARDSQDMSLFEVGAERTDDLIVVDAAALTSVLMDLQSSCTMAALRRGIGRLKDDLRNPGSILRKSDAGTEGVEFASWYLCGELDQVAESQTLERANYYIRRLSKSLTEPRVGHINDINLNRWKEYTDICVDSLWNINRRENSGAHTA